MAGLGHRNQGNRPVPCWTAAVGRSHDAPGKAVGRFGRLVAWVAPARNKRSTDVYRAVSGIRRGPLNPLILMLVLIAGIAWSYWLCLYDAVTGRRGNVGNFIDLTGLKFGRLTVVKLRPEKNNQGHLVWLCQFECGTQQVPVRGAQLRNGNTKSCGCLRVDKLVARSTVHGL
jgi:hypothetical protein